MISPALQYLIYKQQERELDQEIEQIRTARERISQPKPKLPWHVVVGQRLYAQILSITPRKSPRSQSICVECAISCGC